MKNFLITPPFAQPLYILPISLWMLCWVDFIDAEATYADNSDYIIAEIAKLFWFFLLPVICYILFLILRNYPGCVPLSAWNHQKPGLSLAWSILFLTMTFVPTVIAKRIISHELANAFFYISWMYLCLAFRSILVEKTRDSEVALPSTDQDYLIYPKCRLEQWRQYDECQRCGRILSSNEK